MFWQTSRRKISLDRPLVMGILNVTPDSFSDGGRFASVKAAIARAEEMVAEGVGIIDIGGESTRPGSERVSVEEEIRRTVPVIEAISNHFDVPVSIDTCKADVAVAAVEAGAEIINDISGLRFDERIAAIAAEHNTGLVLMHSRGEFESMHSLEPVADVIGTVIADLQKAISTAAERGVGEGQLALDVGIGFGKTVEQNLELIGKLLHIAKQFPDVPLVVGASRKSFIGKMINEPDAAKRGPASVAAAVIAAMNGAMIVRVHDVKETVDALQLLNSIRSSAG